MRIVEPNLIVKGCTKELLKERERSLIIPTQTLKNLSTSSTENIENFKTWVKRL